MPEVQADGTTKAVNGGVVGFFSCEMSAEQLATRILAEHTGIASSAIRRGGINQAEFDQLRDYSIELEHCRCLSTRPAAFRSRN